MGRITAVVIAVLLLKPALPQESTSKAGTAGAQFLKIGVGARAMALAGAFGAVADDPSALYWNPAGLTKVRRLSFFGTHLQWFADLSHQFAGLVVPVGEHNTLGLSATFLNTGEIEITTIQEPAGTGFFYDASDVAIGLSYARQLTDRFSVGLTGKFVQQSIYNESASAFAVDIGTLLHTGFRGLKIGMQLSNFGGKLKLDGRDLIRSYDTNPRNTRNPGVESRLATEPWDLPLNFRVGVAMDVVGDGNSFLQSEASRLTVAVDGNHPIDGPEVAHFGVEYRWHSVLSLRGGYRLNYDVQDLTYGAGLQVPISEASFFFDFATTDLNDLGTVNFFSVRLEF